MISHLSCDNKDTDPKACIKEKLTFIWLIALALMHLLLAFIVVLRNEVSKIFNEGVWIIKILFVSIIGLLLF
jgi:hypothetical protein